MLSVLYCLTIAGYAQTISTPTIAVVSNNPTNDPRNPFEGFVTVLASSTTPGVSLRYTIDGSEPSEGDLPVPANGQVTFYQDLTLKVRAWKNAAGSSTASLSIAIPRGRVAAGDFQSFALSPRTPGFLLAWGKGAQGRLGDGGNVDRGSAVSVDFLSGTFSDAVAIASGREYYDAADNAYRANSLAISKNGDPTDPNDDLSVWAFGNNSYGQLGTTAIGGNELVAVPVKKWDSSTSSYKKLAGIRGISVGQNHCVAVGMPEAGMSGGYVWTWGADQGKQRLGDGDAASTAARPYAMRVVKSASSTDYLSNVVQVAAGVVHTLALDAQGNVWAWGSNEDGQLGLDLPESTVRAYASPVKAPLNSPQYTDSNGNLTNIKYVVAGARYSLAVTNDGNVFGWGEASYGRIGDGTSGAPTASTRRKRPVKMNTSMIVASGATVRLVAAGTEHSLILDTNGKVWATGRDNYEQLGNGSDGGSVTPTKVILLFSGTPGTQLSGIMDIAAGERHSLALGDDGVLVSWGTDSYGVIGDGSGESGAFPRAGAYPDFVMTPDGPPSFILKVGQRYIAPGNIELLADAQTIYRSDYVVSFYANGVLLGQGVWDSTITSYRFNWTNVPAGTYRICAEARRANVASTKYATTVVDEAATFQDSNWFYRGLDDPAWAAFVIPIDFRGGAYLERLHAAVTGDPWYYRMHRDTTRQLTDVYTDGSVTYGDGWKSDTPIAAFGGPTGGVQLQANQSYTFALHAGHSHVVANQLANADFQRFRIKVFPKYAFSDQSAVNVAPIETVNGEFSLPPKNDDAAWASFARDGFVRTFTTSDINGNPLIETRVKYAEGATTADRYGTLFSTPFIISHRCLNADYYFEVGYRGYTTTVAPFYTALAIDHTTEAPAFVSCYTLDFEEAAPWRSTFLTQPHFSGTPIPSPYWGKTVEELTMSPAYVQKQFDVADLSPFIAVDNSVELLSHTALEALASDLGIVSGQPASEELVFRIINFVFNEIEVTDGIAPNDSGAFDEKSINAGGVNRGALGVLLERQGSPAEQCALLIYLLRRAQVPAAYAFASHNGLKMLDSQMSKVLRVQLRGAQNAIGQTNIPHEIAVNYPWVALYFNGQWRHVFPWMKDTEIREGYDLYDYMPEGYRSGADWAKKYLFNIDDLLTQIYPNGEDAAEKVLARRKDNGASIFKSFVERTLQANHPSISLDDIGIKQFVRRANASAWVDLPRPWRISEMTGPITLKKDLSEVQNAFDTIGINAWSDRPGATSGEPIISFSGVPAALLCNRRIICTTTPSGFLTLTLAPWESTVPGQTPTTETTGTYDSNSLLTWKNRRVLSVALDPVEDLANPNLKISYGYSRHRTLPLYVYGPGAEVTSYPYYPQIETLTPLFVWGGGESSTASKYEFTLKDVETNTILALEETFNPSILLPPTTLTWGRKYMWWVRAFVDGAWTEVYQTRAFQTAESAYVGGNDWEEPFGIYEDRYISDTRSIRPGDLNVVCTHVGRVTKEMVQPHIEEYLRHQQYLTDNPSANANFEVVCGGLGYLMGASFYEKISRFDSFAYDLHKVRIISNSAFGLARLIARKNSDGTPAITPLGSYDYVSPALDMLSSDTVLIGNWTARLDSGLTPREGIADVSSVRVIANSSLEHAVLDAFYPQLADGGGAVSTVRLLHLAKDAPGIGIVTLTSSDYLDQANDLYTYAGPPEEEKQLKDWNPEIWSKTADGFEGFYGEYQIAYMTPVPIDAGAFKGMAALVVNPTTLTASIDGVYNGGYVTTQLPANTFGDGRSIFLDPSGLFSDGYAEGISVFFDEPTLGSEFLDGSVDAQNYGRVKLGLDEASIVPDHQSTQAWTVGGSQLTSNPFDSASSFNLDDGFGLFYDFGYMGSEATSKTTTTADPSAGSWVSDPVNTITGEFYIDSVDLALAGPMPLVIRRNYGSQNLGDNDFGWGWKLAYFPFLSISLTESAPDSGVFNPDYQTIYAAETDGSVIAYTRVSPSAFEWRPKATGNPQLANQNGDTTGSIGNLFNAKIVSDPSFQNFTLNGTDGSVRTFQVMSFPKGGATRSRPYLKTWIDHVGNSLTFTYETTSAAVSYGHLKKISASNGNFINFAYDALGHIKEIAAGDGRRIRYDYNDDGDLVAVTFPDASEVRYEHLVAFQDVEGVQKPYSTHLIKREIKPNGRILENTYDNPTSRRVVMQRATVGENNALVTNATFSYFDRNVIGPDEGDYNPFEIDETGAKTLSGTTIVRDAFGLATSYDYSKGQVTRITDAMGQTIDQIWYPANTVRTPGDTTPGAYPRSVQKRIDARGIVTEFKYDGSGNLRERKVSQDPTRDYASLGLTGDLTGDGVPDVATTTIAYNSLNLPTEINDPGGKRTVMTYGDADGDSGDGDCNSPYVLMSSELFAASGMSISKSTRSYYSVPTQNPTAKGLVQTITEAAGTTDAATTTYTHDGHGFILSESRPTGTTDPTVVMNYRYNLRGELVEATDAANQKTCFAYDAMGNRIWQEKRDAVGKLVWWEYDYYNRNGQLEWTDGPRYNPEDYVLHRYDGAGRPLEELHLRSRAKVDGSGVELISGDEAYSSTFFKHDAFGNLEQIIDPRRNATTMGYDALGRMMWRMSFEGVITTVAPLRYESFLYEPGGLVKRYYNPIGGSTKKTYTIDGKLAKEEQILGVGDTAISTRQWRYYPDGRLQRETLPNGTYWVTVYDDALRKITKTLYRANGLVLATQSATYDRRGNVISTTDVENYTFTRTYDRLNRIKTEIGPPATAGTAQQTTTYTYDSDGITSTVSHSGIETVITRDAVGRTTSVQNWDFTPTVFSEKTYSYSDDYQSVTEKAGTSEVISTSFTDNAGHTVLIKHPDNKFARSVYDAGGNLLSAIDEASRETRFEYNGLNQLTTKTLPGGASESFIYDPAGNLWSRQMPGGLHHEMSYDSQSRKTTDSLWSEFGQVLRSYTYQYYPTNGGKLQWVNDLNIQTNFWYDDFDRVEFKLSISLHGLPEHHQEISYEYDNRNLLTNAYLETEADGWYNVNVNRSYDGYGQMKSEIVSINAIDTSSFSQEWNPQGVRSVLNFQLPAQGTGAGRSRTFSHYTNGLMSEVYVDGNIYGYEYDYNKGLIYSRINLWRDQYTNQRDSRGRILNQYVGVVGSGQPLTEVQTWSDHSRLETYTANRTGSGVWNETRNYSYNTRGQLTNESDVPAPGVVADFIHRFDFESPSAPAPGNGLGVRTLSMRRIGTAPNDAQPGSWKVTEDDEFLRPATEGPATGVNTYATASVTYDQIGQQQTRTLANGNVQTFTWDASGHLLKVAERNGSNSGFDFVAIYDALGRRIRTVQQPIVSGLSSGSPFTLDSLYDPEVEFLEIGVAANGARSWKIYGPDLSSDYGGLQGIGGLEAVIDETSGTTTPVVNDVFGNTVGRISGGAMVWNLTKVGSYGILPGSTAQPLDASHANGISIADATVWRGHRLDPTGLYYLGARYYDPASGRFLSPDPSGHNASWSLYDYAAGDPINFCDPDGRLQKRRDDVADLVEINKADLGRLPWWDADGYDAISKQLTKFKAELSVLNDAVKYVTLRDQISNLTGDDHAAAVRKAYGPQWMEYYRQEVLVGDRKPGPYWELGEFATKTEPILAEALIGAMTLRPTSGGGAFAADAGLTVSLADDIAVLKSIRRYTERLVQGKVTSPNAATMMDVRDIQAAIANGNYRGAGTGFHSLNFGIARDAKSRGFLQNLSIDLPLATPGGFLPSRRPDYLFDVGAKLTLDIKPFRPSAGAYNNTRQFRDIRGATGIMPVPLYYQLW